MIVINHNLFRNKLYDFTKKTFDLVSTIDHPYASPPIRLIDGHSKLKKIKDANKLTPLICIWDVNFPDINRYRYDLSFDAGIMGNKEKDLLIFSDKFLYPLQKPKLINFFELKKRIQLILQRLQNLPKDKQKIRNKKFTDNLDKISDVYIDIIKKSKNGTDFYQNLSEQIYYLIDLPDLANFFQKYSQPYFNSAITQQWIPYCIKKTQNQSFGLLNLIDKKIFKTPLFRNIKKHETINKIDKSNIECIIAKIKKNELIPSYEIFFWTLFLADIKHFGNDYKFFDKLNQIAIQYNFKANKSDIQLTEHNQDTQNIIQFDSDRSFNCFYENNKYTIKKNNPIKTSRISNITALYCHLGKALGKIIQDIFEGKIKTPKIITMGKAYYE